MWIDTSAGVLQSGPQPEWITLPVYRLCLLSITNSIRVHLVWVASRKAVSCRCRVSREYREDPCARNHAISAFEWHSIRRIAHESAQFHGSGGII